jgi:hypothetical protein
MGGAGRRGQQRVANCQERRHMAKHTTRTNTINPSSNSINIALDLPIHPHIKLLPHPSTANHAVMRHPPPVGQRRISEQQTHTHSKRPGLTRHLTGSRSRSPQPHPSGRGPQAQAEGVFYMAQLMLPTTPLTLASDACTRPSFLLHGRQVPWMLHHHHRLLARPDGCCLRRLLSGPVPAYRW